MRYVVTAGSVSAETQINERGSRATVDHPRGSVLPDDVPDEQLKALLARGAVEALDEPGEPDEVEQEHPDELDGLDKDHLVELAERLGVEIDKRWGDKKIAAAIRENQK